MILVLTLGLGILFLRLYRGSSNETYALLFGALRRSASATSSSSPSPR